jgi:hypothetical protein
MKIRINKSDKTIKKEERKARIESARSDSKTPTNKDIKQLLLDIYDEIKES